MDMKHDFPAEPKLREKEPPVRDWLPEAYAIAGIFFLAWAVFAVRIFFGAVTG